MVRDLFSGRWWHFLFVFCEKVNAMFLRRISSTTLGHRDVIILKELLPTKLSRYHSVRLKSMLWCSCEGLDEINLNIFFFLVMLIWLNNKTSKFVRLLFYSVFSLFWAHSLKESRPWLSLMLSRHTLSLRHEIFVIRLQKIGFSPSPLISLSKFTKNTGNALDYQRNWSTEKNIQLFSNFLRHWQIVDFIFF